MDIFLIHEMSLVNDVGKYYTQTKEKVGLILSFFLFYGGCGGEWVEHWFQGHSFLRPHRAHRVMMATLNMTQTVNPWTWSTSVIR